VSGAERSSAGTGRIGRRTLLRHLGPPPGVDDLRSLAAMARTDVNARWQAEMAPFFENLSGRPDEGMVPLTEIFHVD
jgi:hypothetical protein